MQLSVVNIMAILHKRHTLTLPTLLTLILGQLDTVVDKAPTSQGLPDYKHVVPTSVGMWNVRTT